MYVRLVAAAAAAALLLAACGDGSGGPPGGSTPAGDAAPDGPSPTSARTPALTAGPEERAYFDDLARALTELSDSFKALTDLRNETFDPSLSEQERREGSVQYGLAYEEFASSAQSQLAGMTPPAQLRPLHDALAGAAADLQRLGEELRVNLEAEPPASSDEFGELFLELNGLNIEQRFWDACFDLKLAAGRMGLSADFDCGR